MSNRHRGRTIACTYSPEFRGLVFKINPHDMSCMYKTMFETCATNTLRDFNDVHRNNDIEYVEPKSSLIIDTADNDFREWQVCENTHKWFTDYTERMAANGGCNLQSFSSKTTRSQSAFAKLESYSIRDDRLKHNTSKLVNTTCRKAYSTDAVGSKSFEHRLLSPHLNSIYYSGSCEIQYNFHHHPRYQDHIRQYREQYTQRRMKSLRSNINEYRSYQGKLPGPQILERPTLKPATANKTSNSATTPVVRCFDIFDSVRDMKVNDSSLKPTPKRPMKKKIWKSQVPLKQVEINQPVIKVQCHQHSGIRMDDGGAGGGYRRMFTSEDLISSEPETCHRLSPNNANKLLHIRSRPSISSKTRGSKTDESSYVVTYLKK